MGARWDASEEDGRWTAGTGVDTPRALAIFARRCGGRGDFGGAHGVDEDIRCTKPNKSALSPFLFLFFSRLHDPCTTFDDPRRSERDEPPV